ncbi:MAG TPA: NAD(P)/FAD-dependent oxidoreductase [Trebonia sp.]|jgi:phytoene dehydrogenase-like protein|nr:NAD(P)/FAD-dependent oxidoreductase [Trebonia sp.]
MSAQSLPERCDAIVIGGGAAGLAAARHLAAAGAEVLLLEAAGRLGGRIVTDDVDGFRLDRGFQVINTAYPALPRLVDLASLDLRYFDHAVLLGGDGASGGGPRLLADPRRHPGARALWRALDPRSAPVPAAGLARLALLSARLGYARPASLLAEPEASTASYLGRRLDERTITTLVEPFLTGVFGEQALATSSHVTAMIWRSFVRGRIGVPAAGMARLPQALAAPLPAGCVRLSTPVTALGDRAAGAWPVRTEAGTVRARAVIVATDPATAARLVPGLTAPAQRILVTTYHAAAEAPARRPALLLDGTGRSGIANSITLTLAAPGYAPPGRHLIATTAPESAGLGEGALRRHLAALYGAPTGDWEHIATVRADPGLVAAPPPQGRLRQPVRFGDGLLVAGDHRDTPSLQGALVSGGRAARAALRELGIAR